MQTVNDKTVINFTEAFTVRQYLMNKIQKFYDEYKPYIFSDGWYYVFIVVFILLLFIFFS